MHSRPKLSKSVIAAGVVAIIGSLVTALVASFFLFIHVSVSYFETKRQSDPFDLMFEGMFLMLLVSAIFGVFVGFGLLRRKNWARISALVWAPMAVLLSLALVLSSIFIPLPIELHPLHSWAASRVITALVFGLPLGIGIWWLILFNRREIILEFWSSVLSEEASASQGSVAAGAEKPLT